MSAVRVSRDPGVELLRCVLMFTICLYHVLVFSPHHYTWLIHLLLVGVVGFVFITGWYGVKFSWKRVLRLYAVGAYGALVAVLIDQGASISFEKAISMFVTTFRQYWFLHAYVILLIFAPLVDGVISSTRMDLSRSAVLKAMTPILVLVFVWSFLGEVRILSPFIPISNGLTQLSGYTLIGIYVGARLLRLYDDRLPKNGLGLIATAMAVIVAFGFL